MIDYTMTWNPSTSIAEQDAALRCRQVYVWLVSADQKVAIVSKDGAKWQFPGGKPDDGETMIQTAIRETHEETGLDIRPFADSLEFFGYYVVNEIDAGKEIDSYIQARYLLRLPVAAADYTLHTTAEDEKQDWTDVIRYAEFVAFDELEQRIGWIANSDEYNTIREMIS